MSSVVQPIPIKRILIGGNNLYLDLLLFIYIFLNQAMLLCLFSASSFNLWYILLSYRSFMSSSTRDMVLLDMFRRGCNEAI